MSVIVSPVTKQRKTRLIDITGQQFNRWTVIKYVGSSSWLCRCSCGTERPPSSNYWATEEGRNRRRQQRLSFWSKMTPEERSSYHRNTHKNKQASEVICAQ